MPSYRGKFQYFGPGGPKLGNQPKQQGACQIAFDEEKFTLAPESGPALDFDLGDIDALVAADYEIRLPLYGGDAVLLQQFGKAYQDLSRELTENYRQRTLQCLLLEDMEEVERFTGAFTLEAAGVPAVADTAELRLFKSNLAVLPTAAQAFQWRLADIDAFRFDAQNYEVILESGGDQLRVNRLAKRTELFQNRLREALDALHREGAKALHGILPFLSGSQLQNALTLLPEGHSTGVAKLAGIDARVPQALAKNAVDDALKPYYEELTRRAAKGSIFAGYKLIRLEEKATAGLGAAEEPTDSEGGEGAADGDADAPEVLYWFFFPIATKSGATSGVVAWEASSRSGRATYFFRLDGAASGATGTSVEQGVARITRVLGLVNFRRRPIYLSDDDLTAKPELYRYAVAARKIADLRTVRKAFLGRAIHSSFEAWQSQVDAILAKAGS